MDRGEGYIAKTTGGLMRPPVWHRLSGRERISMINGCGGSGAWYNFAIPNNIGTIDIYPACAVHDVCYATGYLKIKSDAMFLYNMVILITGKAPKLVWVLYIGIAILYYLAVALFGDHFYYKKTGKKRLKRKGNVKYGRA